jgi:hypothetical protein
MVERVEAGIEMVAIDIDLTQLPEEKADLSD